MKEIAMKPQVRARWANISLAMIFLAAFAYLFAEFSDWKNRLEVLEFPHEEFGQKVTYPSGFWLEGAFLGVSVSLVSMLFAHTIRRVIITLEGFHQPIGSAAFVAVGYLITGLGVSLTILTPSLGSLVYIPGIACIVLSLRQVPKK
jgi:hypothetical protein